MSDVFSRRLAPLAIGVVAVLVVSLGPSIPARAAGTADLSVSLHPEVPSVREGMFDVFTAVVSNGGPDATQGIVVTDPVPSGLNFDQADSSSICSLSGATVTCQPVALGSGQHANVGIAFRTTTTGSFMDSVSVSSPASDPTPADNSASADVTVTPPLYADLSVRWGGQAAAFQGQSVFEQLTVQDNGPDTSTGYTLTITVPQGLTPEFGGCTASTAGSTCTDTAGSQPPGSGEVRLLRFSADATGTFTLSATVAGNLQDPNAANDTATTSVTVTASADLALASSASPNPVVSGHQVAETVLLTNKGPSPASGVSLDASWTSDAKGGIDFESASVTAGSCAMAGATVTCSVGDLANGQQVVLSIVLQPRSKGSLTIDSSASSSTPDPATANNTSQTDVTIS